MEIDKQDNTASEQHNESCVAASKGESCAAASKGESCAAASKDENCAASKGKPRAVATIIIVSLAIVALSSLATHFLFFGTGNNADESRMYEAIKRYKNEQMIDSLRESLGEYFDLYNPDAFHYSEVKSLRDQLISEETDWMDIEDNLTADVLRNFLMAHPDGLYSSRANACLDSLLALEVEEQPDTIIHHVPDSVYVDTLPENANASESASEPSSEEKLDHHHESEHVEIDSIFG